MGIRRAEESDAWKLAHAFTLEVYRIVRASADANRDYRFRDQIFDAASSGQANIEEGFHRFSAGEIVQFLSYARASVNEALGRLADGVDRQYYPREEIARALELGARAAGAIAAWQRSLKPFAQKQRR